MKEQHALEMEYVIKEGFHGLEEMVACVVLPWGIWIVDGSKGGSLFRNISYIISHDLV